MKKRFIAKTRKKTNFKLKIKVLGFVFLFFISISVTYNYFLKGNVIVDNKMMVDIIMNNSSGFRDSSDSFISKQVSKLFVPYKMISRNYKGLIKVDNKQKQKVKEVNIEKKTVTDGHEPYIYLYNSHQTEEYVPSDFLEYTVKPTVTVNNYIMKEIFNKNGYNVLIEERKIKDVLNSNNWKYNASYKASRVFLEDVKKTYPSLDVFIDVHRDSLNRDKTSITIGDKRFAKIIFLIGLENSNYQENLAFTEKINNIINNNYPGLSKGIYKKGGAGVNGVYNQDFSGKTILVEIGGVDNTIEEVMNSSIAVSQSISEVLKSIES